MANALLLRRRIRTAQNVSKTTRAMQMIAASKLKKAQAATLSARPYVENLTLLSQNVMAKIDTEYHHPYMRASSNEKTLVIVISPDRGLCGGLITNLVREYLSFQQHQDIKVITVGKKIEHTIVSSKRELIASFAFGTILPTFDIVYPITKLIDELFLSERVGSVKIVSNRFESIFIQKPIITHLLPLPPQLEEKSNSFQLFEPSIDELLPELLKRYLEMSIYQHLLESFLSEQAARMLAMQNATNNAKDIIEDLTLEYNKARQAKITSEILDITGASIVTI